MSCVQFLSPRSTWRVLAIVLVLWTSGCGQAESPLGRNDGIPSVRWSDAKSVVGQQALVSGKIVRVGGSGTVNFLNFDSNRDAFTVVVFERNLSRFPGSLKKLYDQKLVTVRGEVTRYKGAPQIVVTSPEQISIVKRLPEVRIPQKSKRILSKRGVRVATFNVLNLYDDVDDEYTADETTNAKPREELERLAQTIRKIDADVMALQEVEGRGYLQRFVNSLLPETGYEVVHFSGNDRRGSNVALLSRIPVGAVTSHRHRRIPSDDGSVRRFSRDLLCVELLPVGRDPFEVWVTHLKSKRGGAEATEPQRLAEAGEIRRLLEAQLKRIAQAKIVVVGDFNDSQDSAPIRKLIGSGPYSLTPLWSQLPEDAVTYNRRPYREMIDFVLCSPAAASRVTEGSHRVLSGSVDANGSDHNPIWVDFRF